MNSYIQMENKTAIQFKAEVVTVTPLLAKKWLDQNTRNRKISRKKVRVYAKDMTEGRWSITHQGLAFYDTNELADGQHRLQAVVDSGITVPMQVTWGLPPEIGADIDRHRPRSETDAIRIGGLSDWIGITEVSVIKAIVNAHSDSAGTYSAKEIASIGDLIKENVKFPIEGFTHRKKYVTNASVMAAVAIAYDHVDHVRLLEFCDILLHGMPDSSDDVAAIRLREHLLGGVGSSSKDRRLVVYKTMRAIEAFCSRERIKRLRTPTEMIYRCHAIDHMLESD